MISVLVDAAQVSGGDREIGVPELALDHHDRYAFAGHFNGAGVAELVRRESAAHRSASAALRS